MIYNTRQGWMIIQKSHKSSFEWSKIAKKVFCHFLDFGHFDQVDVAYNDGTISATTFCNLARHQVLPDNDELLELVKCLFC